MDEAKRTTRTVGDRNEVAFIWNDVGEIVAHIIIHHSLTGFLEARRDNE